MLFLTLGLVVKEPQRGRNNGSRWRGDPVETNRRSDLVMTTTQTQQATIVDAIAAREAMEHGLAIASDNNKAMLALARRIAHDIAVYRGTVYADLIIERLTSMGFSERALGNAGGAVFRDGCFEFTGEWHRSTRVIGHGNRQRIWRLKPAGNAPIEI